ncbi:CPBP family intramembrane glutamic endopeptidase [Luteococcus sanguinis]|uniref:CPBP family intramembrane glutamic endopeptidase n=1 Tax=Luteococcus sanguinis TaxID=174038 RepID=A0ABW1WYW0_9ACTN
MSLTPVSTLDPPAGVDYAQVTTGPDAQPASSMVGALMGLAGYFVVVPLVAQLVIALGWYAVGRPSTLASYTAEALRFEHPIGMFASHLALALLIPIAILVTRWIAGRHPKWLASVQPGVRWRYLLACFVIAAVLLNAVLLVGRIGTPWQPDPQANVWGWLLLVLLTSPFQAAAEEVFFRGFLLQSFGALARNRWAGVVASALIFALMHGTQNLPLFLDRLGFGLLAGWLVLRTGGLEAGIGCHVANNLFAFGWAAFFGGIATARTTQVIGWGNAASDLFGFALFAAIAWWLAGRMNLATRTPGLESRASIG